MIELWRVVSWNSKTTWHNKSEARCQDVLIKPWADFAEIGEIEISDRYRHGRPAD